MLLFDGDRLFLDCDKVAQDKYNIRWHPGQKILLIIKASTTLGPTIKLYAPGTYMRIFRPQYYCEKPDLAL